MEGFFFFCYVVVCGIGIGHATARSDVNLETVGALTVYNVLVGLFFSLALFLGYHAGVYNYITGYDGNLYAFMLWAALSIISVVMAAIQRKIYTLFTAPIALLFLGLSGGFVQFGNLF